MSTITVVTVDAGGNVPPALRIAGELARRGHRVEVLGHARQADAITSTGLGFRSLASLDFWDPSVRQSVPAAIDRIVAARRRPRDRAGGRRRRRRCRIRRRTRRLPHALLAAWRARRGRTDGRAVPHLPRVLDPRIRARTRRDRRPPPRRRPASRVGPSRRSARGLGCRARSGLVAHLAPSRRERMDRRGRDGCASSTGRRAAPARAREPQHDLVPRADRDLPAHHRRARLAARARPGHARRAPIPSANCGFPRTSSSATRSRTPRSSRAPPPSSGTAATRRRCARSRTACPSWSCPCIRCSTSRWSAPRSSAPARASSFRGLRPPARIASAVTSLLADADVRAQCRRARRATAVDGCRLRRRRRDRTARRRAATARTLPRRRRSP